MNKRFFLVHGIDGQAKGKIVCRSKSESFMLFMVKMRAIDPFQRLRDVGSDRPPERLR